MINELWGIFYPKQLLLLSLLLLFRELLKELLKEQLMNNACEIFISGLSIINNPWHIIYLKWLLYLFTIRTSVVT